jgi:hypothetical protein
MRVQDEKSALLRRMLHEGDSSGDAGEAIFERLYAYIDEMALKKAEALADAVKLSLSA